MRKNLLLTSIIIIASTELYAQVEKNQLYGDLQVGRRLFYYNANTIQPSLSIGISDHSTLGIFYSYTRINSFPALNGKKYYTEISGAGISYTHYRFFCNSIKWGWYGKGSLMLNTISNYDKTTGASSFVNRFNERELSFTPGVFFKASKDVMLYGNIGDISLTNSRYGKFNMNSSLGRHLNLGIQVNLMDLKKKKGKIQGDSLMTIITEWNCNLNNGTMTRIA